MVYHPAYRTINLLVGPPELSKRGGEAGMSIAFDCRVSQYVQAVATMLELSDEIRDNVDLDEFEEQIEADVNLDEIEAESDEAIGKRKIMMGDAWTGMKVEALGGSMDKKKLYPDVVVELQYPVKQVRAIGELKSSVTTELAKMIKSTNSKDWNGTGETQFRGLLGALLIQDARR